MVIITIELHSAALRIWTLLEDLSRTEHARIQSMAACRACVLLGDNLHQQYFNFLSLSLSFGGEIALTHSDLVLCPVNTFFSSLRWRATKVSLLVLFQLCASLFAFTYDMPLLISFPQFQQTTQGGILSMDTSFQRVCQFREVKIVRQRRVSAVHVCKTFTLWGGGRVGRCHLSHDSQTSTHNNYIIYFYERIKCTVAEQLRA